MNIPQKIEHLILAGEMTYLEARKAYAFVYGQDDFDKRFGHLKKDGRKCENHWCSLEEGILTAHIRWDSLNLLADSRLVQVQLKEAGFIRSIDAVMRKIYQLSCKMEQSA